jgi:hypothetical protein
MIVLWGLMEDGPLAAVWRCLEQLRIPTVFIDQRRLPEHVFELETGERPTGRILGPGGSLDLNDIRSIYVRPYNFADLDIFSGADPTSEAWKNAARFEESMLTWCELTDALVVNRPGNMGSNNSKPFQLEIIRDAGFRVPETLITTDPASVVEFWKKHGRVIYKSISSWRSIVSQFTQDDLNNAEDVACCPTQFQRFVEGTDYRVHVLDDTAFAHRINCIDDDYRYSEQTDIEPSELDSDLEERCVTLTRNLGLVFAGIDLRRSVDGDWYCFEVNPSPGFTYFDQGTGNISLALAKHLAMAS